jgi:hypothetical protein
MNFRSIKYLLFLTTIIGSANAQQYSFERFQHNPIITENLLQGSDGDDINGPSLIKVPDWVPNKLGKYYLYFAHHKGKYIRLAYANDLQGPWKIYKPGTLQISDCKTCENGLQNSSKSVKHVGAESADDEVTHIASPDVLVDNGKKELVLYFHCPIDDGNKLKGQYSLRATSKDGIHFTADSTVLGYSYFRVFKWKDNYYSISRAGLLAKSPDGIAAFEEGPKPFKNIQSKTNYLRHAALKLVGDTLFVFYSRIGDAPERIVLSKIALNGYWQTWTASAPTDIAAPAEQYEGVDLPIEPSAAGLYYGKVRQLRDPYLFEENKKWYLLYSAAGESSIVIGELRPK